MSILRQLNVLALNLSFLLTHIYLFISFGFLDLEAVDIFETKFNSYLNDCAKHRPKGVEQKVVIRKEEVLS